MPKLIVNTAIAIVVALLMLGACPRKERHMPVHVCGDDCVPETNLHYRSATDEMVMDLMSPVNLESGTPGSEETQGAMDDLQSLDEPVVLERGVLRPRRPDPFRIIRGPTGRNVPFPAGTNVPVPLLQLRGEEDSIVPVTFTVGATAAVPTAGLEPISSLFPVLKFSWGGSGARFGDIIVDLWPGQKFTLVGSFFDLTILPPSMVPLFPGAVTNVDMDVFAAAGILPGAEGSHPRVSYQNLTVAAAATTPAFPIPAFARFLQVLRTLDQQMTISVQDAAGGVLELVVIPAGGVPALIPLPRQARLFTVQNNGAAGMNVTPVLEYAL